MAQPSELVSANDAQVTASRWRRLHVTLWEAAGWTFGYLIAQAIVLAGLLLVMIVSAFGTTWPDQASLLNWCLEQNLDTSFLFVGASSLGTLFVMVPLVRWREGKEFRQKLGWRNPTLVELIYASATIVPIALLGNVLYDASRTWQTWPLWPFAAALRETSLDQLYSRFQGVSFPVLVVALALGPAVGEELIFRGVLGRRLISRYGLIPGVALTSICFAAAHVDPMHAVATLPIAVLLHVLYLKTGTIWVPILVHFGNNLLALSLVRFEIPTVEHVPPVAVTGLCVYLAVILCLMHVRVRNITSPALSALRV